jgi:hypothetical protein
MFPKRMYHGWRKVRGIPLKSTRFPGNTGSLSHHQVSKEKILVVEIDARGHHFPLPVFRTKKVIKGIKEGELIVTSNRINTGIISIKAV